MGNSSVPSRSAEVLLSGLEAGTPAAAGLLTSSAASSRWGDIAVVPLAVVFDYKGRENRAYPAHASGLAALENARECYFPCGSRGAGRFVHCGSYFGKTLMEQAGQGAAFAEFGATNVAVFAIVNARGVVVSVGKP